MIEVFKKPIKLIEVAVKTLAEEGIFKMSLQIMY
jgi:hypothetical protein